MTYITKITKTLHGTKATTEHFMCDVAPNPKSAMPEGGKRFLRLSTSKPAFERGIIITTASCYLEVKHDGYGSEIHACGMGSGCGDYYKTVAKVACKRVTEAALVAAH